MATTRIPPLPQVTDSLRTRKMRLKKVPFALFLISGVAVVTKRNLISEAIPFVFIVLKADVTKPGLAAIESAEHILGMSRTVV